MRFVQIFPFFRHFSERVIVLFYCFIPSLIAFNNKNRINKNFYFFYKYCLCFVILLFLLPGFQSDYAYPVLMLLIIPSGIILENIVSSKEYLKIFPILLSILIFANLYSLFLPNYANRTSNLNQAKNILLNGLRDEKYLSNNFSRKIFLTSRTKYIAPYLYNENDSFELNIYNKKNLKDELDNIESKEFFLVSEKNIFENKKFINSIKEICSINEISKTYLIPQIFTLSETNNPWQSKLNFNLYVVSKCAE